MQQPIDDFAPMKKYLQPIQHTIRKIADALTDELVRPEEYDFAQEPQRQLKTKILSPDEDVKKLIISANSLEEVWDFLVKRLRTGPEPSFVLFSVVDEVAELLRLRYLVPQLEGKPFHGEFIPLCDKENHLVKTVLRSDTTFTDQLRNLGLELYPYIEEYGAAGRHNIFSIPLVAGNRTIATITLGFNQLDSFSQAKLSYVYLLRDQLAQLVWNLILQERIQNQPQLDNLTGLMTYSSFHQTLAKELRRSRMERHPLSLLLIDINNLKAYNERYSHQMGDRAIAHLASLVKYHVRGIDTIARYGPDKIAVILPGNSASDAALVANGLIVAMNEPHKTLKPFSISIGIACYPQDSSEVEGLVQIAENALQFCKYQGAAAEGRSTVVLASRLNEISDRERVEVFMAQIAKKYGETGSELFETILERIGQSVPPGADNLMLETVTTLASVMDAKDGYASGRSQLVSNYAVALASAANLPAVEVEKIRLAAFFHDIGKTGISESILNKPGVLTPAEMEVVRQHPVIGARQILQPVAALRDIIPIVEYHHERWDGTGHPEGLKGENIPIGARIVSIADAFHALTSDRPYRPALLLEEAIDILREGASSLWDPELVRQFIEMLQRARCPGTAIRQSRAAQTEAKI